MTKRRAGVRWSLALGLALVAAVCLGETLVPVPAQAAIRCANFGASCASWSRPARHHRVRVRAGLAHQVGPRFVVVEVRPVQVGPGVGARYVAPRVGLGWAGPRFGGRYFGPRFGRGFRLRQ